MPSRSFCATLEVGLRRLFSSPGWGSRIRFNEPDVRSAAPTRIRLCVKAAIQRIVVFGLALQTHRENGHGCLGAVVGNTACNCEAGAAVRAIEKGIAITAVG